MKNIILTENNQTVREEKAICQIFNSYFTNVTQVSTGRLISVF